MHQQVAPSQQYVAGGQQFVPQQGQQYMPQSGQAPVIIVNAAPKQDIRLLTYNAFRARICGYILIAMGSLAMIFNIVAAILNYNSLWAISTGWWGAPFIITAGRLGVASARYKTRTLIKSTLGFVIVSCIVGLPLMVQGCLAVSTYDWYGYNKGGYVAVNSLLIVVTIVEVATAIYQCILCCMVTCDCCKEIADMQAQQTMNAHAQYGQQQFTYNNPTMEINQQQMQIQQFPQQQPMYQQEFVQPPMPAPQPLMQQQYIAQGPVPPARVDATSMELPPSYDNIDKPANLGN